MGCRTSKPKACEAPAAAGARAAQEQRQHSGCHGVLLGQSEKEANAAEKGSAAEEATTAEPSCLDEAAELDDPALLKALQEAQTELAEEALTLHSHRTLEPERRALLASAFPELAGTQRALALAAWDGAGALRELVALVEERDRGVGLRFVTGSCQITFADISPSECVEYTFGERPGEWAVAQLSRAALESYRSAKLEAWRHLLLHATCEAQLRRMLQQGPVSRVYDEHVFPTPEALRPQYQVADERTGRTVRLPHPVAELRAWDPAHLRYEALEARLAGAPPDDERDEWWAKLVEELKEKMGTEYITSLMATSL